MNIKQQLISMSLGRNIAVIGHAPTKLTKNWILNNNYKEEVEGEERTDDEKLKFVHEEIDTQKAINSAYETTFDYLLKEDKSSPQVKNTFDRLLSRSKGTPTGILFDSSGRKITTRDNAINKINEFKTELTLLQEQKNKSVAKKTKEVLPNAELEKELTNETTE